MVLNRPETPKMKEWQRQAMARGIKKKLQNIEAAFKEVDLDGSGLISHAEFIQLLRRLGMGKTGSEESFSMMQKYRSKDNHTGDMTFDEFKACMTDYMKLPTDSDKIAQEDKPMPLVQAEKILAEKLFNKFSAVQRAFRLYDEDKSGELSYDELRRMFRSLNVILSDEHFIALVQRYDPNGDGSITYEEFNQQIGPLIHPDAQDSSRSMQELLVRGNAQDSLVFDPNKRESHHDEDNDVLGAVPSSPSQAAAPSSPSKAEAVENNNIRRTSMSSTGAASHHSHSQHVSNNNTQRAHRAGSIATSQFDVSNTEEKMRRVLGRSWVAVYRDVKKSEGVDPSSLEGDQFRDIMAEKGVPLTAKEVRALSLKYHGGEGQASINVNKLMKETFKGPLPVGSAAGTTTHSSTLRPSTATARQTIVNKAPAPSAFLRPSTASPNGLRAVAMSNKPVF
jgi:Ca2+-binding EF-hand superfamily protein